MDSTKDVALASPTLMSFPHKDFDFGGTLDSRTLFHADKIVSTKASFEAVLASTLAVTEWKDMQKLRSGTSRRLPINQHHLRDRHGTVLYSQLFECFGLRDLSMMPRIASLLANIHPMQTPNQNYLYRKVCTNLKTIKAHGSAFHWSSNANLQADELQVEALWALALIGTATDGFGVLARALIDLLNETGLTWIMLPSEIQNIPDCWKLWAIRVGYLSASPDQSATDPNNQQSPENGGAAQAVIAQASSTTDEDADIIFQGSRQISHQTSQDHDQQDFTTKDEHSSSLESVPVLSHAPRSPGLAAAAYLAGDEIFKLEDDDAMNYYQLDSLDDVRRLHSSMFTPKINMRGSIRADMTKEDLIKAFEGFQSYVDQRITLGIQAAVVQSLMAPAMNERIREVIYDMQDRGQNPVPSARRRARSPDQNPASPRQRQQQSADDTLARAAEVAQVHVEHTQKIEDLERSHESNLRQLRDAHEARMQQVRDAQEAATRAALARIEPRSYSRKRTFDPEEFGHVVKRRRSD